MVRTLRVLPENEHVRTVLGVVAAVAFLLAFTEIPVTGVVPIVLLLGGMALVNALVDRYDLPDGTDRVGLGVLVLALAVAFAAFSDPRYAAVLTAVGLWIALDGYTAARTSDRRTHELAAGIDDDPAEAMLRMQTLNVVNRALADADGPRAPSEVAADVDLPESRVEPALSYLESKDHAERVTDGYRGTPPRWGRLYPVVAFARWLPRRLFAPIRRLARN